MLGINSYVSLEEANTYFNARLNNGHWLSLDEPKKQASLIQATQIIDSKNYNGQKTLPNQPLRFPRKNIIYDGEYLKSDEIPLKIKQATCELAIHLLSEDVTAPSELGGFERVKLGVLEVQTKSNAPSMIETLPPLVKALLNPFLYKSTRLYRG